MNWLKRIPFLSTLTALALCVVGLGLRLLPGTFPVVLSFQLGGKRGGSAIFMVHVERRSATAVKSQWMDLRYDFKSISPSAYHHRTKDEKAPQ